MLTKKQVCEEHDKLISLFGGAFGINYEGKIENAVNKFNENPDKREACIEFYYDILIGHPFIDGNKRTATHFLEHLLELNGYKLRATNEELVTVALDTAKKNEEMERKHKHAVPLEEVRASVVAFIT